MKINVKTVLKNSSGIIKKNFKAIKKNDEIIYNDDCLIKVILSGKIIRENDDYYLELDLINEKCIYLLKQTNSKLNLNLKVNTLEKTNNSLKVDYLIEDENIIYEIEEVIK